MNYHTYQPHSDLNAFIKCYWTLEVPSQRSSPRQRIVPDGCLEMIFIFGDDIKRYTSQDKFIIQPRAMILGQITEPFFVEPTGNVNSFAVRFYPYGFASFTSTALKSLANKETPINLLFGDEPARELADKMIHAKNTNERIKFAEDFLLQKLKDKTTIDAIVKETVDTIFMTEGSESILSILKDSL